MEAARRLGVSRSSAYGLVSSKALVSHKFPGHRSVYVCTKSIQLYKETSGMDQEKMLHRILELERRLARIEKAVFKDRPASTVAAAAEYDVHEAADLLGSLN